MRILIVDDEPIIREGIKKRIIKYGYNCEEIYLASNAMEAQIILKEKPIDVVFVDINMPFMNGLEMIEKYQNKNVHFVIISGYDRFEYAKKAIELKVEAYLLKPIDKIEFKNIMDKLQAKIEITIPLVNNDNNIRRIMEAIYSNYQNANFSLHDCAFMTGFSEGYITKLLKKANNNNFVDTLNEYRIKQAIKMLDTMNGMIKMKDLAKYCGFSTPQYFSTVFRKHMNITPSQYISQQSKVG
ncbi:MAG: response regulator [Erysipelotrichaceae bacterium]|nr:response regulator [Erysipelotrichaceae bacterium]MDY5252153.1 response regulator [Erysipelotrichaceae bacterium]